MTAREQLADVIEDAIDGVHSPDAMARDYANAAADAVLGMVKPLEFSESYFGIWEAGKRFTNDCAAYKIIWDLGRKETYTAYFGNDRLGIFPTLEAAQDATNDHHRAQWTAAFGLDATAQEGRG